MNPRQYHALFPHSEQEQTEKMFQLIQGQAEYEDGDCTYEEDMCRDEEETIDEDLLKKTSELHQALRNIKLLRFQLVESRIMKRSNPNKCLQHEQAITAALEKKAILEQENDQLDREIHLYSRRVKQHKENNRLSYETLAVVESTLNKARLQQREAMQTGSLLDDKENISALGNYRYISLDKISVQAYNKGSQEMIGLIKEDIAAIKQRFAQAEAKKKQLQSQYTSLLQQLKALKLSKKNR